MHILSAFAEWIGKPDRADTPSFATNPVHLSHLNARVGLISEALTATRPIPQSKDLGVLACRLVQSIRCMPFWCRSCRIAWAENWVFCSCLITHRLRCRCRLGLCGFCREYPKFCVWISAHAVETGLLVNCSGETIANSFLAAIHSLTVLPAF